MQHCPTCGHANDPGDTSCRNCGAAIGNAAAPPEAASASPQPTDQGPRPPPSGAPPPTSPAAGGSGTTSGVPRWLATDWPLAVLCVATFLAVSAGVGALFGFVAGLIANGFGSEGFTGLLAGAWLPFAGLGSDAFVGVFVDSGGVYWYSAEMLLTATVGLVVLAWRTYRAAWRHVGTDRDYTLAFVAKVAVTGALVVAILGNVLSIGDTNRSSGGFEVLSRVGSAEPAWAAFLLLGVVGLLTARARLGPHRWSGRLRWARPLRYGIAAWAVMVLALGSILSVAALVSSDDATEGFAGATLAPVVVGNAGVSAHAFSIGASNDTVADGGGTSFGTRRLNEHISLFHHGLPPDDDSGSAPLWLWPLLLAAPALVFLATRQWFQRTRPQDAAAILAAAATVAGGFALASWLGALWAPLDVGAGGRSSHGGPFGFDTYTRAAVARPSVGAVFGLSIFWGLLGAVAAAAVWARQHGIDLITSSSSATHPDEPAAPPAPNTPPDASTCPQCGAPLSGTPFCGNCGARVQAPPTA